MRASASAEEKTTVLAQDATRHASTVLAQHATRHVSTVFALDAAHVAITALAQDATRKGGNVLARDATRKTNTTMAPDHGTRRNTEDMLSIPDAFLVRGPSESKKTTEFVRPRGHRCGLGHRRPALAERGISESRRKKEISDEPPVQDVASDAPEDQPELQAMPHAEARAESEIGDLPDHSPRSEESTGIPFSKF